MSEKPKLLCVGDIGTIDQKILDRLGMTYESIFVENSAEAFEALSSEGIQGILVVPASGGEPLQLGRILQNEQILEDLPDGVALLCEQNRILWSNQRLSSWFNRDSLVGLDFYEVFGEHKLVGLDICPLESTRQTGEPCSVTVHCNDNRYFRLSCASLRTETKPTRSVVVTLRDVTTEALQQQKLNALHHAGRELADLTAEEVFEMEVEQRIELLKSNILYYSKDILNFDVVEIRLISNQETGELVPLLSEGIEEEASKRPLFAAERGYGVTGYVAATGTSYMCSDTTADPLYLEGCKGAKSSLTVPLVQHDQVIGTFNVESPEPGGFTEQDLQFLEIFSRDIANALHTLELLVAQQANTAQASVEAIHSEVALPVDAILNDAVNVMEHYIGHDQSVVERLKRILQNARDIKQLIYKVGQEMAPAEAVPACLQTNDHMLLKGRRVLVVDDNESVRGAAHNLLERFECVVETAHDGSEALNMIRNSNDQEYDAVLSEINLPDMTGHELLLRLKKLMDPVPMVLMTGFGYDPGHTIVKARQAGLLQNAVLYKPFRLDQLLGVLETVIESLGKVSPV